MIESVCDPLPECRFGKENVLLAEYIELRISVKDTGWDELVKDANDEWGKDGEDNVVKGERPWLEGNLTGEVIEEGELKIELK